MSSPPAAPADAPPPSPWDAHATVYEQVWERSTSQWGRDALVLGRLPEPSTSRLLDVACGAGSLAITTASMGFDVTATDLSTGMITKLQGKVAASTARLKIHAKIADGQTLEGVPDASFDVYTSVFGVFLFPDRMAAWKSAHRVLKPGGRLISTSWDAESSNVLMIRYLMEKATDLVDGGVPEGPLVSIAVNRTMVATLFREELEECGFRDVEVHTLTHPMCFKSGAELVEGVLDNAAFRAMLVSKEPQSVKRCILNFAQIMLDRVDPFGTEAKATPSTTNPEDHPLWGVPFAFPATAHIAVATKP